MPNTLAHIAVNGLITKSIIKKSDLLWIYIGCIIPDIPWIIRKVIDFISPSVNGFDLQSYAVVQSSLLLSIILSAAFALLSKSKLRTFIILSLGSILHLIFDMLQIKWANGVLFFAPLDWNIINFGIFWPESIVTYIFTILGFIYFILHWGEIAKSKPPVKINKIGFLGSSILLIFFFTIPYLLIPFSKNADNHFVHTLADVDNREGKYVEIDRKPVLFNSYSNSYWIESFDRSLIELTGLKKVEKNRISIKGKFLTKNLIKVDNYHENWEFFRDGASYVGLFLVLFAWIMSFINRYLRTNFSLNQVKTNNTN